jgi:hypothetical protein
MAAEYPKSGSVWERVHTDGTVRFRVGDVSAQGWICEWLTPVPKFVSSKPSRKAASVADLLDGRFVCVFEPPKTFERRGDFDWF